MPNEKKHWQKVAFHGAKRASWKHHWCGLTVVCAFVIIQFIAFKPATPSEGRGQFVSSPKGEHLPSAQDRAFNIEQLANEANDRVIVSSLANHSPPLIRHQSRRNPLRQRKTKTLLP